MEIDYVNDESTPITDETFKKQGWEKNIEDADGESFYYWTLPLPIDNPDPNCPCLISNANDDWKDKGLDKNTYVVEIFDLAGLGYCEFEEQILDLYSSLTNRELNDKVSEEHDNLSEN